MANLGEGPGPYFYTKLRPEGPKKIFLETGLPRLSKGLDDRPLPPQTPPPHPTPPTPRPSPQGLDPALTFEQHASIEPRSSFSFVSACFQGYISNTKKCTIHCCH